MGSGTVCQKLQFPSVMVSEDRTIPQSGRARTSRTIPRMHRSLMPHQGILPRLFPGMSMWLQDNKLQKKMFSRERPDAAWGRNTFLGMLRLALIPATPGLARRSARQVRKHFLRKLTFLSCGNQNVPLPTYGKTSYVFDACCLISRVCIHPVQDSSRRSIFSIEYRYEVSF